MVTTRQALYLNRNIEVLSPIHCSNGKQEVLHILIAFL